MTLNILMVSAEYVCFIYIGLSLLDTVYKHSFQNVMTALIILGFLLISRSICLGFMAFIYRKDDTFRVSGREWIFLSFSGLIKGPITYIFANVIVTKSIPCLDVTNKNTYISV